jgi:hypothetical protein
MRALFIALGLLPLAIAIPSRQTAHDITVTKSAFGTDMQRLELPIADSAGHVLVQWARTDSLRSSEAEFPTVRELVQGQGDWGSEGGAYRGYSVIEIATGDRVYTSWRGAWVKATRVKPGLPVDTGTIVVTGGTGRYRNIRGRATYRGFPAGKILEEWKLRVTW